MKDVFALVGWSSGEDGGDGPRFELRRAPSGGWEIRRAGGHGGGHAREVPGARAAARLTAPSECPSDEDQRRRDRSPRGPAGFSLKLSKAMCKHLRHGNHPDNSPDGFFSMSGLLERINRDRSRTFTEQDIRRVIYFSLKHGSPRFEEREAPSGWEVRALHKHTIPVPAFRQ